MDVHAHAREWRVLVDGFIRYTRNVDTTPFGAAGDLDTGVGRMIGVVSSGGVA
jgi:hypothetical protein